MQSNDQKRVFKSVPQGVRKIVGTGMPIDKSNINILLHCCLALYNLQMPFNSLFQILATNIAETSITINDVVYVIDSGKVKEVFKLKFIKFGYQHTVFVQSAKLPR